MSTNIKSDILEVLQEIEPISLKEMDHVKLMRRTDTKYVFHVEQLPEILNLVAPYYKVLEIKNSKAQNYNTVYYDTPELDMYHMHQCGRVNRNKVRFRKYMNSEMTFLEVKNKNNKKETIKSRVKHKQEEFVIHDKHADFLEDIIPYDSADLVPQLNNHFTRLMLVSKVIQERITIDFDLSFLPSGCENWTKYSNICIAEVKRNVDEKRSDFIKVLKEKKIKEMRFSKYCMGLALLDENLKQNRFKPRLIKIKKLINKNL